MKKVNIMHVDMDAFYASVEMLDNPELKGKPVIVGGVDMNNRGVVSTASYEARKYGVHSAMPIYKAKKLCPNGIYISGRMERYKELSIEIHKIFHKYTPKVEKISIDEAFLDLKGCHKLFGTSEKIGKKIKNEIEDKVGLTASVGISKNKFLAKLASTIDKPDGFKIIYTDEVDDFLDDLPIGMLWGVGNKTEELLHEQGVKTIGMLKKIPKYELENQFGKLGIKLYNLARGKDNREVISEEEIKSISQEETFSDNLTSKLDIFSALMGMTDKVSERLHNKDLRGKTVFIKVRYSDFKTYTRRKTVKNYINSTDSIYDLAKKLLINNNLLNNKPIRLLGIGVSNLSPDNEQQLSLFEKNIKKEKLNETIFEIKDKFGSKSLRRGIDLIYDHQNEPKNKKEN
ncbi:MAG TPA: DNA polymerase IV [Halanaerobiales bacterium]|nr:DNA polymerase IV [Halanaerobiales bacterium]